MRIVISKMGMNQANFRSPDGEAVVFVAVSGFYSTNQYCSSTLLTVPPAPPNWMTNDL